MAAAGVGTLAAAFPGSAPASDPGLWESLSPTPSARQEVSYLTVGNKMYLAGGASGGVLAPHQVYDPATNTWATLTQLGGPIAPRTAVLDHIQAVTIGGRIYYVGGLDDWPGPPSAEVYIYDPATDSFATGASMPRPRGAGGVVAYGGRIYYVGGLARDPANPTNYIAVDWVDVYDPATDSWSQLTPMPTARDHLQAAVVDGRIYAIGGRNKSVLLPTTVNEVYDIASDTWATGKAPLPTARGGYAMAQVGRELVVIGGEGPDGHGGTKTFDNVEAYDVDTDSWRSLAPMPHPRHGISAAVCNGGIYLAAGGEVPYGGSPSSDHDVLFPDGVATPCPPSAPEGSPPRLDPQAPGPLFEPPAVSAVAARPGSRAVSIRRIIVHRGFASLRLGCPRGSSRCLGTIQIQTTQTATGRVAAPTPRRLVLGRVRYSIAAGMSATARVTISRAGRLLLARRRTIRATLSVTPRGAARPSRSQTITLRG